LNPRRRDLFAALWRREVNGPLLLTCAAAAALGVYAGVLAVQLRSGAGMPVLDRFILSFDTTALMIVVFMTSLRVAVRTAEDHTAAWLDPWLAQGGDRAAYLPAVALTAAFAGLVLTAAAGVAYGLTLLHLDGSTGIVRRLPRILAGGALVLVAHALFAGLIGLRLRNAPGTLAAAAMLTVAPVFLLASWLNANSGAEPPRWLHALSVGAPPPLYLPGHWKAWLWVGAWSVTVVVLSVPVARRFVGRRP
jgi:hypothetical protein